MNELCVLVKSTAIDSIKIKEITDVLWKNVQMMDEYLVEDGKYLMDEHKEILRDWKRWYTDTFILERCLKSGTIFVNKLGDVFQVIGIYLSWKEMFGMSHLPLPIHITMLPFKGVIITDGINVPYSVYIDGGKKQLKESYLKAKANRVIRKCI